MIIRYHQPENRLANTNDMYKLFKYQIIITPDRTLIYVIAQLEHVHHHNV